MTKLIVVLSVLLGSDDDPGLVRNSFYDRNFMSDPVIHHSIRHVQKPYLLASYADTEIESIGKEYALQYMSLSKVLRQPIIVINGGSKFLIRKEQSELYAKDFIRCGCVKTEKINLNNDDHVKGLTIENFLKTRGLLKESYVYNMVVSYYPTTWSERSNISLRSLSDQQVYVARNIEKIKKEKTSLVPVINLPVAFFLSPIMVMHYFTGATVMVIPVALKKKMNEVPEWVHWRLGTHNPAWVKAARLRLKGLSFEEFFKVNGYLPGDRSWKDMVYNFDLRASKTYEDQLEQTEADPYMYDYYGKKEHGTFGQYTQETTNLYDLEMWRYRRDTVTTGQLVDKYLGEYHDQEYYDNIFNDRLKKNQKTKDELTEMSKKCYDMSKDSKKPDLKNSKGIESVRPEPGKADWDQIREMELDVVTTSNFK